MTSAFEQAHALVPRLSADERNKLRLLLIKHSGERVKASKAVNELDADWLLRGICRELERRGLPHHVGSMIEVRRMAPDYELSSQEVRQHLEAQIEASWRTPTRTELFTLGNVAGGALADYFKNSRSLKRLLNVAGRTVEALEASFPGYLQSGYVYVLLQRKF